MGKKNKNKHNREVNEFMNVNMELFFRLDEDPTEINIPIVAEEIKKKIQDGASVDNISRYRHEALRNTLSYYRVSGRSRLTYKEDMAKRLVEVFGQGIDGHGKKSKENKEKKMTKDEMTNMVIREIKRKGGI